MSALGDALTALRGVVLIQERLDVVRREVAGLSDHVRRLDDRVIDLKERVIRIETLIDFTRSASAQPPRIAP